MVTALKAHKNESILNRPGIFDALDAVAAILPAPVYWHDTTGVVLGINDQCLKAMGASREIVGKRPYDFYPKEVADHILEHNKKVMSTEQILSQEEMIEDITTKQVKYFTAIKAPLYDDCGRVIGIVGTSIDITAEKEAEKLVFEQQEKFRKIVHQTVHDIRSPLTAMYMILPLCNTLPEKLRTSLNTAAVRMLDIANELLNKVKPEEQQTSESSSPALISAELLEIITEKKYEHKQLPLNFTPNITQPGYFAFINVDAKAFKRALSNLINNAVDAFDGGVGKITIHLDATDSDVRIIVEDNGKGMPEAVKEKILNNIVVTSGKINGNGLGFSQIREALDSNDGTLSIESEVGIGTKIILTFPKIENPEWVAEKIELHKDTLIVILDDDESIHGAWEARFKKAAPHLERRHFKSGNEAVLFINGLNEAEKEKIFLLTDYELLQQGLHGLGVINQTGIKNSILVTSHHINQEVRDLAKLTNTRILPKPLASEIPIFEHLLL